MPLAAQFAAHRTVILGTAAGGAALLGLRARAKGTAAAANSTTTTAATTSPQLVPQGAYDSTANDVYNAIEPQIEALNAQLGALAANATTSTPAAAPPTPAPSFTSTHVGPGTPWGVTGQPSKFPPAPGPYQPGPVVLNPTRHAPGGWGSPSR